MEKKIKILKCVFHGIETGRFPLPLKGDNLDHEIMIETTQPTSCSSPINMSYHLFFERYKATGSLPTQSTICRSQLPAEPGKERSGIGPKIILDIQIFYSQPLRDVSGTTTKLLFNRVDTVTHTSTMMKDTSKSQHPLPRGVQGTRKVSHRCFSEPQCCPSSQLERHTTPLKPPGASSEHKPPPPIACAHGGNIHSLTPMHTLTRVHTTYIQGSCAVPVGVGHPLVGGMVLVMKASASPAHR